MKIIEGRTKHFRYACRETSFDWFQDFIEQPEGFLKTVHCSFIKDKANDPTTVTLIEVAGRMYLVKRYNLVRGWHQLKVWLRGTHAYKSWRYANYLYSRKLINVPPPVGVCERQAGLFHGEAYFVSEFLPHAVKADTFLRQDEPKALKGFAVLTGQLYQSRIQHNDLQFENILFVNGQPCLVDFDHVRHYPNAGRSFEEAHRQDIERFKKCLNNDQKAFYQQVLDESVAYNGVSKNA